MTTAKGNKGSVRKYSALHIPKGNIDSHVVPKLPGGKHAAGEARDTPDIWEKDAPTLAFPVQVYKRQVAYN